jgi:phosphinothricin acetyltransferase
VVGTWYGSLVSAHVRLATAEDLDAVNAIYNHYVLHSTCTFQTIPSTRDERLAWFAAHDEGHPVTVAVADGEIVGWGALSVYNPRQGYRRTVENSVYVRHDRHRRGAGRALLADLLDRARALGHHTVIAGIAGDQAPSVALHQAFGFVEKGRLAELGHKLGRWIDVLYLQRML